MNSSRLQGRFVFVNGSNNNIIIILIDKEKDNVLGCFPFFLQYFPPEGIKVFGNLLHTHLVGKHSAEPL